MTIRTKSQWTPAEVKKVYQKTTDGHFFDRDTMEFFGDTMDSYGVTNIDGVDYLYRKKTATVNVFGEIKTAGRDYFNAWQVILHEDNGQMELGVTSDNNDQMVWDSLYPKSAGKKKSWWK